MEKDILILAGFFAVCAVMYFLVCLIPAKNRTKTSSLGVCVGFLSTAVLTCLVWYMAFFGPTSRNWGLGGAYLWMLICPALFLLSGIAVTLCNAWRKKKGENP